MDSFSGQLNNSEGLDSVAIDQAADYDLLKAEFLSGLFKTNSLREALALSAETLAFLTDALRLTIVISSLELSKETRSLQWVSQGFLRPVSDQYFIDLSKDLNEAFVKDQIQIIDQTRFNSLSLYLKTKLEPIIASDLLFLNIMLQGEITASVLIERGAGSAWDNQLVNQLVEISEYISTSLELLLLRKQSSNVSLVSPEKSPGFEKSTQDRFSSDYQRVIKETNLLIFETDTQDNLRFVSENSFSLLGLTPSECLKMGKWYHLFAGDQKKIQETLKRIHDSTAIIDEEFEILNKHTNETKWLLVHLVPVSSRDDQLLRWEGLAFDITERKLTQRALEQQNRKIKALYTVSAAIRGYLEPKNIANRGLVALCEATQAKAGVCFLYSNSKNDEMKLITHVGFSENFSQRVNQSSILPNLSNYVAKNDKSIVVPDILKDSRANQMVAVEEGLRSAVLVPIRVEDETLGTLGLFSDKESAFDGSDVMLVSSAANQIGLSARQANLLSAYRQQAKNLASLYRVSHELSQNLSLEELFQQAFTVIRDELGLKRMWLGLLNETGTRIIGQAAYGPGWRKQLVEINIEIKDRQHPIARVVRNQSPIIISNPDSILQELGLKKVFARLGLKSIAFVPLVSSGQVVGVLAVQPNSENISLDEEQITLLSSLASEIAVVILSKRLEERIADSEKMKTASLLAAGIAHNFNNLLQAIFGQASLLELQSRGDERVAKSVGIINEAANKGALLVKQLLSFAHLDEPYREKVLVNDLIDSNLSLLRTAVGPNRELLLNLDPEVGHAEVDSRQLVSIVRALINNSVESTQSGGLIEVRTRLARVEKSQVVGEVPVGEYVVISVKDNGRGMDEETRRRCFEPFFTTKNVDQKSGLSMSGSGLGLAAAYALARRNSGRLIAETKKGYGSIFSVYIPVAKHSEFNKSNLAGNIEKDRIELPKSVDELKLKSQVGKPDNPNYSEGLKLVRKNERK